MVRLKSGDPLIFGRAAEEMAALTEAGVAFEVVPGITAAFAAAAAIPCSLTDRNTASNVIFSTGHHAQSHNHAPVPELEDATRVVYMPGRDLSLLALEWLQEGLPADFPARLSPMPHSRGSRYSTPRLASWEMRDRHLAQPADCRMGSARHGGQSHPRSRRSSRDYADFRHTSARYAASLSTFILRVFVESIKQAVESPC